MFDFDGVMTDNRVWVDEDGREMVAANRSDSLGLNALREAGIQTLVISTETNPVVAARCRKLKIEYVQGVEDKATLLRNLLARTADRSASMSSTWAMISMMCPVSRWSPARWWSRMRSRRRAGRRILSSASPVGMARCASCVICCCRENRSVG